MPFSCRFSVWGPLRDRTFRAQAQVSIAWAKGVVASLQTRRDYPLAKDVSREIHLVQTQCRTNRNGTVNYTPYNLKTQTYQNGNTNAGYLKCVGHDAGRDHRARCRHLVDLPYLSFEPIASDIAPLELQSAAPFLR
jgi:hypothetical protein